MIRLIISVGRRASRASREELIRLYGSDEVVSKLGRPAMGESRLGDEGEFLLLCKLGMDHHPLFSLVFGDVKCVNVGLKVAPFGEGALGGEFGEFFAQDVDVELHESSALIG